MYTVNQVRQVGGKEWQRQDHHRVYIGNLGSRFNDAGGLGGMSKSDARILYQNVNIMMIWYDVNILEWQHTAGDLSPEKAQEIASIIIAQLETELDALAVRAAEIEAAYGTPDNATFEGLSAQVKMIMKRDEIAQSTATMRVCKTLTDDEVITYLQTYKPNWWDAKNIIKCLQNGSKTLEEAQLFTAALVDNQMKFGL